MFRSACCSIVLAMVLLAGCDRATPSDTATPSQPDKWDQPSRPDPVSTDAPLPPALAPQKKLPAADKPIPTVALVGPGRAAPQQINTGKVLPLARILMIATKAVPGEVVEVDLEDDDDNERPVYALEILTPQGRSIDIEIDARSGKILEIEED